MFAILHLFSIAAETVSTTNATEPWVIILLALISVAGVIVTAWFSYMAQKHAKESSKQVAEVNDAVNHRKPGQDRLFDMVASTRDSVNELSEWKEKWDNMSSKYRDPNEIATSFAVLEDRITTIGDRIDKQANETRKHIDSKVDSIEQKVLEINDKLEKHIVITNAKENN